MSLIAFNKENGTRIVDGRYGTVIELVTPVLTRSKNIGLAYVEVDPGKESPEHFHRKTEEVYYFISGSGLMTVDGQESPVGPGDSVYIPIGSRHKIKNMSINKLCFISADAPPYDPEDDFEL
jgi:mannose-6-phosphate isomerase-like protein (cupin superfamily)